MKYYNVREASILTGFSIQSIYKKIDKAEKTDKEKYTSEDKDGKKLVTEAFFRDYYNINPEEKSQHLTTYEEELERVNRTHSQELQELRETHAKEVQELKEELRQAKEEHSQELRELKEEHSKKESFLCGEIERLHSELATQTDINKGLIQVQLNNQQLQLQTSAPVTVNGGEAVTQTQEAEETPPPRKKFFGLF